MFTEFDQFYERFYNLPFGLAQVGKSYRNEISCQPFTRLKEFTQAEVEYFL
jgi:glycyl-tRNA synthetase (class II)